MVDHIEWDLCSSPAIPETTPEAFAKQLCADIGLRGEAVPIIAHALHEEILKHKKDAIEWGVLGVNGGASLEDGGYKRNQRGPRKLRGVWRDWMEFSNYGPRMEILTPEELEKKEMERERASRYVETRTAIPIKALTQTIVDGCVARPANSNATPPGSTRTRALHVLRGFDRRM